MVDDAIHTSEIDPTAELATNISETVSALFSAGGVQETLVQVVHLAVTTVEGCDFAGIFLVRDNRVTTPVSTDPVVIEVDALQHSAGEGPCLDAMSQGVSFYADDLGE